MSENYDVIKNSETEYSITKNGVVSYKVTVDENNNLSCDCPGFTYRGMCKHIDMVKSKFTIGEPTQKRIPRYEINKVIKDITPFFNLYPVDGLKWEVVGSYRRGKPTSKDIDIIASFYDVGVWDAFIDSLIGSGRYQVEVRGDLITRGLYHCYEDDKLYPIDINRVAIESDWTPQLLYRTGSKEHNIKMRAIAKQHGWTLNEHGLFDNTTGQMISEPNWEELNYFNALMMPYKKPEER